MRSLQLSVVALFLFPSALPLSAVARYAQVQDTSGWKTLPNKAGWSIKYPPSWTVWSCHSCPDPTAPNVYANFGKPSPNGPHVMVEPLADKPPNEDVDKCLNLVKTTNNLNPIVSEDSISVNGLRGLRVKYRTAGHTAVEETYIVSGSKTFAISSALDNPRAYAIYQQMVNTFIAKRP